MDSKKEQRLAYLNEREARWRESVSVVKCRCGHVLGRIEWRDVQPDPGNRFKTPPPHMLRLRGATPLGDTTVYLDGKHPHHDDEAPDSSPRIADIRDGVRCDRCGTVSRRDSLAERFEYDAELASLRRRKYAPHRGCVGTVDAL